MLDPIATDRGERELDRLIERAARGSSSRDKANLLAQEWAASEKRHREKLREANRWEWVRYFECLAANHAQLSEENRQKAARLLEEGEGRKL